MSLSRGRSTRRRFVVLCVVGALAAALVPAARAEHESDEGALARRWVREGFLEGWAMQAADLDGDGADEIVYGGRGIAALDDGSRSTRVSRWSVKWNHEAGNPLSGGDNGWVTGMEMLDVTGDDVADALVTTENTDAYLIDGANGSKVWSIPRLVGGLSFGFALLDVGEDEVPDMFPTGGSVAISGATGETLWEAPIPRSARFAVSGNLDDEPGRDVALGIYPPGAGTNPNSIVPALTASTVFAASSGGELLYDFKPVSTIRSLTTADLTGDGIDEIVVGTFNGIVYAIGSGGLLWSTVLGPGQVTSLTAADTTGDGREELFAAHTYAEEKSVSSLSPEGATLWRHIVDFPIGVLQIEELDDDGAPELLVGGGTENGGAGLALNAEIVATREMWRVDTFKEVKSFAVAQRPGAAELAIGSGDGLMNVVDAATGAPSWQYAAGGYLKAIAAADLDGDGLDEVIGGDQEGLVTVTDTDGTELWFRRADIGSRGLIMEVAADDVDGDGSVEVAAAGERLFQSTDRGVVELYSADGSLRWSTLLPGFADEVSIADLDKDGHKEIVVAEGNGESGVCSVVALDPSNGEVLWRTNLFTCLIPHIDVADIDGDGLPEIGYGEQTFFSSRHIALLEHDGAIRWSQEVVRETTWVEMVAGGFVHGGFATESRGFAARREQAAGDLVWETFLPDTNDLGGASRYGVLAGDPNSDFMVAVSSDAGDVHLLDGSTGERRWATRLEPPNLEFVHRHQAGPLAYVAGENGRPPVLFAAQYGIHRKRSKSFALSMDGTIIGSIPMEGDAEGAAPARLRDRVAGAVVGAGLGVYALEVDLPTTDPSPTPSVSPSGSPTASPTASPTPPAEVTDVAFTERSATAGQYSDETSFEAKLSGSDMQPIADTELAFTLTGAESSRSFTATTDGDGVASVTPILTETPGPYQLTVRYEGDEDAEPSADTTSFVVEKEDTAIQLSVSTGQDGSLEARLSDLDSRSDGISGRVVEFFSDSESIGSAVTDDNGVATLRLPPGHRGSNRTYRADFEGDGFYLPSSDESGRRGKSDSS